MIVDFRPTTRLRGARPLDLGACLGHIVAALSDESVDLSRLRVVCDWVQYEHNFRDVVDARPILPRTPNGEPGDVELAVDLRRSADTPIGPAVRDTFDGLTDPNRRGRLYLEPWTRAVHSRIWEFNALYWRFLGDWERTTGQPYEQALPGGESDARNVDAARELILDMFAAWDALAVRNALPDELYVVELGVGNGSQAKTWLDEFVRLDHEHGRDYYGRLHYLMCDYSDHVLALARTAVTEHTAHVSSLTLDATAPSTALKFLRYKVFLVYISNVYDNLPSEEVAHIGGHTYRIETRAYIPASFVSEVGNELGCDGDGLSETVGKLLLLGPRLVAEALPARFADAAAATSFWRRLWRAIRLEERYVPLPGLDLYEIADGVSGEMLRPLLETDGDIRMHVSNGAVAGFVDTLQLLHPYGRLLCNDLFVTSTRNYHTGFRGPGKYDGSVVNWVNGPLLRRIGSRYGFDVAFVPYRHRARTNIVTMTTQVAFRW